MPAWLWITALAAVAFVFWIGWGRGWLQSWRYDWQRAQHVRERAREYVEETSAFYGSMGLTDEQALHHEYPWWPAPPADPAPWLEQTRAELSPEALDCPVCKPGQCPGSGPGCYWYHQDLEGGVRDSRSETALLSAPLQHDPGPGDAAVIPPASSGPDRVWADRNAGRFDSALAGPGRTSLSGEPGPATLAPSRWLAEQLEILHAWSDWQQQKVRIFA